MFRVLPLLPISTLLLGLGVVIAPPPVSAQSACTFLMPIGGSGEPTVSKRISPDRLMGSTNWNTDFAVDRSFRSYRLFITSISEREGTFPVAGFLRFTDGSNLRLFDQALTLQPGKGRTFGPFPAVPERRTQVVNFRVGSSSFPGSTGFSYRISAQGCP